MQRQVLPLFLTVLLTARLLKGKNASLLLHRQGSDACSRKQRVACSSSSRGLKGRCRRRDTAMSMTEPFFLCVQMPQTSPCRRITPGFDTVCHPRRCQALSSKTTSQSGRPR